MPNHYLYVREPGTARAALLSAVDALRAERDRLREVSYRSAFDLAEAGRRDALAIAKAAEERAHAAESALALAREEARREAADALDAAHVTCNAVELGLPMYRIQAAVGRFRKAEAALKRALATTPAPAPVSPEVAPWYLADGSSVLLPVEEVTRWRKLDAKVIEAAQAMMDDAGAHAGFVEVPSHLASALVRALRALAASPVSSPTDAAPGVKP